MNNYELASLANPEKDQYFLTNPTKLQYILDATAIRATDHVVELGAGAGTVARILPPSASLTLIELDDYLIPTLRRNAPTYASIVNTDGVELLSQGKIQADVILGNLPHMVTVRLATLLPQLPFRVGVLAAGSIEPFEKISNNIKHNVLTTIQGDDFTPPQPGVSLLVKVQPRQVVGDVSNDRVGVASGDLVRTSQAAEAVGVSARSLARWVNEGYVVPEFTTPGGHFRWDVRELQRQIQNYLQR